MSVQTLETGSSVRDRLDSQPWMESLPTRAVIDALEARGGRGCARFVGGCVRNALIGREVDDIDISTIVTADELTASRKARGLKAPPTSV